jgi:hypothetical protein
VDKTSKFESLQRQADKVGYVHNVHETTEFVGLYHYTAILFGEINPFSLFGLVASVKFRQNLFLFHPYPFIILLNTCRHS